MIVYQVLQYDNYYPCADNSVFNTTSIEKAEAYIKEKIELLEDWEYIDNIVINEIQVD